MTSARCIAVGSSDNVASNPLTLIEELDGYGWTIVPSPNPSAFGGVGQLNAVACSSPTHCVSVGSFESENGNQQTLIEEDLGYGWKIVPSPNTSETESNGLSAVACPSETVCIAVGSHGPPGGSGMPLVERDSGSGWTIVAADGVGRLSGIACVQNTSCVATGGNFSISSNVITEDPLIEEMTEDSWKAVDTPKAIGTLGEVACPTSTYCISAGSVFVSKLGAKVAPVIVAERSGGRWRILQASDLGNDVDTFDAVACPTASRCVGVGEQLAGSDYSAARKTFIAEHTDQGWTIDPSPNV